MNPFGKSKNKSTRRRNFAIGIAIALALTAITALPAFDQLHRLDVDILHALREMVGESKKAPNRSRVAVLAIDEKTHASPPFAGLPKVMWTPQIAVVQNAILSAEQALIGWDLILPTSAASYVADRRIDAPLLKSLSAGGRSGRIVLGAAHFGTTRIQPHRLFTWSVGGPANLRSLNVHPDPDGVVRRLPTHMLIQKSDGARQFVPSMFTELAMRMSKSKIERTKDGRLLVKGTSAPGVRNDAILLNFNRDAKAIPTFSFTDLHDCAAAGNSEFFAEHFKDRIVLIGLVLDVEDRKLSSNRLIGDGGPIGPQVRCGTENETSTTKPVLRTTTSGVYLHAVAASNLLQGAGLETLPQIQRLLAVLCVALFGALTIMILNLTGAALLLAAGIVTWTIASIAMFNYGVVLPLLAPVVAGIVASICSLSIRFLILDREGRFLRRAFASYVAPDLVAKLVEDPTQLRLSGERREMTFLFTDLAGFTSVTENLNPEQLTSLLNTYLDGMIRIAKAHAGTIDKVVGDALVVMFSAPIHQPDHASNAVACALAMDDFATGFAEKQKARSIPLGETRIGVHTGTAVVGNFGGSGFFDYTAFGDTVNTAARLESVNKQLGTRIAVSGATMQQCNSFVVRPIGALILKGKENAIEVLEPVSLKPSYYAPLDRYQSAYEQLAQGKGDAADVFQQLTHEFPNDPLVAFHWARIQRGESGIVVRFEEK